MIYYLLITGLFLTNATIKILPICLFLLFSFFPLPVWWSNAAKHLGVLLLLWLFSHSASLIAVSTHHIRPGTLAGLTDSGSELFTLAMFAVLTCVLSRTGEVPGPWTICIDSMWFLSCVGKWGEKKLVHIQEAALVFFCFFFWFSFIPSEITPKNWSPCFLTCFIHEAEWKRLSDDMTAVVLLEM